MRATDPAQFLLKLGILRSQMQKCAMPRCSKTFAASDGVAFEGENKYGVHIFFFCSYECYLQGLPVKCCARA